jgi:L-asparaginase II
VQVGVIRSGLVEARHEVTVAAVDGPGRTIVVDGPDPDRPFFVRSAAKPFQAAVSQRLGADLGPEQMAIAAASHGAQPVHVAYVRTMLEEAGLDEGALRCPPSWPIGETAQRRAAAAGETGPRRIFNNCSGKHAAMLRACVARGWPLEYEHADHPLQKEMIDAVADATGSDTTPVGVDGCGVPTLRGTVPGLARAFARLHGDPDLAFAADCVYRCSALTADGDRPETRLARWVGGPVKGGAMGCVAIALPGGPAVAAKCWSGTMRAAIVGVIAVLRRLGLLPDHPYGRLREVARPPVLGGGRPAGEMAVLEAA